MKYLAIDLGDVVCDVDFSDFLKTTSKTLNVSTSEAYYFLERIQKQQDIGFTRVPNELREHFKIKSDGIIEDLLAKWNATIVGNKTMVNILKSLPESVNIAILSNMGYDHLGMMEDMLSKELLDRCIKFFSCEVGARKPSYIYYKTFLDMHPEFKNCLYIDDNVDNIMTALKFGFKAKQFCLSEIKKNNGSIEENIKEILKLL